MFQRHSRLDVCSLSWFGGDLKLATDQVNTFSHAHQAQSARVATCGRIETHAIVRDVKLQRVRSAPELH